MNNLYTFHLTFPFSKGKVGAWSLYLEVLGRGFPRAMSTGLIGLIYRLPAQRLTPITRMVHASGGSPQLKDTGHRALEMPNGIVNSRSLRLSCSWKCHGMYPNPSKADHLHPGNYEKVDRRAETVVDLILTLISRCKSSGHEDLLGCEIYLVMLIAKPSTLDTLHSIGSISLIDPYQKVSDLKGRVTLLFSCSSSLRLAQRGIRAGIPTPQPVNVVVDRRLLERHHSHFYATQSSP